MRLLFLLVGSLAPAIAAPVLDFNDPTWLALFAAADRDGDMYVTNDELQMMIKEHDLDFDDSLLSKNDLKGVHIQQVSTSLAHFPPTAPNRSQIRPSAKCLPSTLVTNNPPYPPSYNLQLHPAL